jgi:hypothetical protein
MTLPENSEPSVLDYIKSKIFPGRNPVVEIPDEDGMIKTVPSPDKKIKTRSGSRTIFQPVFFLIIALFVMLIGQSLLEPPYSTVSISLVFTASGIIWILYGWFSKKFHTNLYPYVDEEPQEQVFRPNFLLRNYWFCHRGHVDVPEETIYRKKPDPVDHFHYDAYRHIFPCGTVEGKVCRSGGKSQTVFPQRFPVISVSLDDGLPAGVRPGDVLPFLPFE